jgi:hypothetical protein
VRLGRNVVRLRRSLEAVGQFIPTRRAAALLFLLALMVYAVEALAWPMTHGRDTWDYLAYYLELPHRHALFPQLMAYRTPIAPLLVGGSMSLGGNQLLEVVMGLLYAGSILTYAVAARRFGTLSALLVPAAILAYPGYASVFHSATSDGIFAACFAAWTLLVVRAVESPSTLRFGVLGISVALLTLTRPAGAVLLVTALLPLAVAVSWRRRARLAGTFVAAAVAILVAWAAVNGLRYGHYVVSQSSGPVRPHGVASDGPSKPGVVRASWSMLTDRAVREPSKRQPAPPSAPTIEDVRATRSYKHFAMNIKSGFLYCTSDFIEHCTVDPSTVWADLEQQRRYGRVVQRVKAWNTDLPSRDGSEFVADQLARVTWKFPRAPFWLLLFLVGILVRRPRGSLVLASVCLGGLCVTAVHGWFQFPLADYVLPVYPAFIFTGIAAVSGDARWSRA